MFGSVGLRVAILALTGLAVLAPSGPTTLSGRGTKTAKPGAALPGTRAADWWVQHGGKFRAGDPGMPAVLLFHGNHQDGANWTRPSLMKYNHDFRHHPKAKSLGKHSAPNAGIYKLEESEMMEVDSRNWFDYLAGRGFTVACFSQGKGTIAEVMPLCEEAVGRFLTQTAALNPSAPPPVAFVGHSRGGLVIRHLLKSLGSKGRVQWAVMIHTPNQGSQMAEAPEQLVDETMKASGAASLPPPFRDKLEKLLSQLASNLKRFIDDPSRELRPGSGMFQRLTSGEVPVEGVRYYTFGGVNPDYYRTYLWTFTPMSSVPQYKGLSQYFKWEVKPAEIGPVSPMYRSIRHFCQEITPGKGDGLVSDTRSRLPAVFQAAHETTQLNHAEIFWDRPLQQRVATILGAAAPAKTARAGLRLR